MARKDLGLTVGLGVVTHTYNYQMGYWVHKEQPLPTCLNLIVETPHCSKTDTGACEENRSIFSYVHIYTLPFVLYRSSCS